MKNASLILALLTAISQAPIAAANEVINRLPSGGENLAYVNAGWDPVATVGLGYAHGFKISPINRVLTLTTGIEMPMFMVDLKHYRYDLGSRIALFDGSWNVVNRLALSVKGTDNPVFMATSFGVEEEVLFGYFSSSWFVAGEIGYEKTVATYIKNSEWYRSKVHAGARDGLYSSTEGKLILGVQGGYTIADRVELALRVAAYQSEGFNGVVPMGMPPVLANLGVSYHF